MTQRLGPGLHLNVPHDVYHADPCEAPSLSAHVAGILLEQSPRHAFFAHPRLSAAARVEEYSDSMSRGEIVHALVLGGGRDIVIIDAKNFQTKAAQEARDAALAAGKIPIIASKLPRLQKVADAIKARLGDLGQTEVTAVWESPWGALCRARFDSRLRSGDVIVDLKTCENAKAASSGANVVSRGYHVQAAAYTEALETLVPELAGRVRFLFAFAEVDPPWEMMVRPLDGELRTLGAQRWRRAVETWARCLKTGQWDGYDDESPITCPPWAMAVEMEQAVNSMEASNGTEPF